MIGTPLDILTWRRNIHDCSLGKSAVMEFWVAIGSFFEPVRPLVEKFITDFDSLVLIYFLFINVYYLLLLVLATDSLMYYKRVKRRIKRSSEGRLLPSIAILSPAFNEGPTIATSVSALLNLDYPNLEIIVINDGSTDDTLRILQQTFQLAGTTHAVQSILPTQPVRGVYQSVRDKRLIVIDKENGGKADALNAGIVYSRSRLFCAVDADSIIEKDALTRLVDFYLERETKVIALGGTIHIANDCTIENGELKDVRVPGSLTSALQAIEYIRAFLCGRAGWSRLNSLAIISGAFGLFERRIVIEAGGYRTDTVGEDMELVVRMHRMMIEQKRPYRVLLIPEPVCWTQAPSSLKVLGRQRVRWQRGLLETMFRHWKMIGNYKFGWVGVFTMPYYLLFEIVGPVIELLGYLAILFSVIFAWVQAEYVVLFLSLAILYGVFLSLYALLLEQFTIKRYRNTWDFVKLFLLAILENFGYRQLNSWWRFKAVFTLAKKKNRWGTMPRVGFEKTG